MGVTQVEMTETVDNLAAVKKRKLNGSLTFVHIKTIDCSSTGSLDNLKILDLEESVETVSAVIGRYDTDGDKSTLESESKAEYGELESTMCKVVKNPCPRAMLSMEKMPPESELEEFFAAAQEGLNKRFKDKYNFDIVGDTPLEGRYEWIQVMPVMSGKWP